MSQPPTHLNLQVLVVARCLGDHLSGVLDVLAELHSFRVVIVLLLETKTVKTIAKQKPHETKRFLQTSSPFRSRSCVSSSLRYSAAVVVASVYRAT